MSLVPKKMLRVARRVDGKTSCTALAPSGLKRIQAVGKAVANSPPPAVVRLDRSAGITVEKVLHGKCPQCGARSHFEQLPPLSETTCTVCGTRFLVPGRLDGFLLMERIGQGEMGEIYRARDETLHRDVAIKIVRAARAAEDSLRERLSQEARAAARISHPCVAQVYALGFSNRHPYLVMELVQGEDMDARLQREKRIDERTVLCLARDMAEGLMALHRENLTHGDIKPANIVLDRDGKAKLVDFGLSGMARRDASGGILGTPRYMAPESLRGAPDSNHTDLYSLGATLYHLLAGQPPFDGATPTEAARVRLVNHAPPIGRHAPLLSPNTQDIVMRMLARNSARRYPDSAAVLSDIRDALHKLDRADAPVALPEIKRRPAKRRRRAAFEGTTRPIFKYALLVVTLGTMALAMLFDIHAYVPTIQKESHDVAEAPLPKYPFLPEEASSVSAPPPAGWRPATGSEPMPTLYPLSRFSTPRWKTVGVGNSPLGSMLWGNDGALIVQTPGFRQRIGRDDYGYVHTEVAGDLDFSVQVVSLRHLGKAGLMVRESSEEDAPALFFGVQADGALMLQMRQTGGQSRQSSRIAAEPVSLPCRLRITRTGDLFTAAVAENGVWRPVAEGVLALPEEVKIGVGLAPRWPDRAATAEFRDVVLMAAGRL